MSKQFRDINAAEEINCADLIFPRARVLHDAIKQHDDFRLIGMFRGKTSSNASLAEIFIVDVTCDGVPPSNPVGIEFTERLAICVPEDSKALIEVLALRIGFPLLIHQNAVLPDMAPSLCLYQEPARSVSRIWTAPSFLKRIQFWLEQSAHETLHAADQPVEQLFFTSPFALVLPWNFEALQNEQNTKFWVAKGPEQPGDNKTFFLESSSARKVEQAASVINLNLPPVVHGRIESDFGNLGQLACALTSRGVDLFDILSREVQNLVGNGIDSNKDDPHTVLLMHIPVTRAEDVQYSKIMHRAYLVTAGMLKLGEAMGVIFSHPEETTQSQKVIRYYKELTIGISPPPVKTEWQDQSIFPMEVLHCINSETARHQSGVIAEGPIGTLIGAGALGSALLDMWTRSGWGEWSIIDNDHIKPHNLVRHQADASLIGASKAEAAVFHINCVMQGATKGTPIHADACDLSDDRVLAALHSSKLIVDASTTLDYPRLISTRDDVGRHASVFVTPSANAGVLLLEDVDRKKRLRTLEAQYYRAIISEEWGRNHLDGNLGSYWSGASCRDISLVMPYSKIIGHTAVFAEHIPKLSSTANAAICVWSRDEITGAVSAYNLEVNDELRLPFDGLELFIDTGVQKRMALLRDKHLPYETGGILLGYHDFNINAIVVVDALTAPRDSKATSGSFERGLDGVIESVIEARRRTANIVGYIGEWHSHPKGHSTNPSSDDKYQLVYLTQGLAMEGLPAIMLIVGDNGLCALQGVING